MGFWGSSFFFQWFRVLGFRFENLRFRVQGFEVWALELRILGLGFSTDVCTWRGTSAMDLRFKVWALVNSGYLKTTAVFA